jgi:hypothetical protein
VCITYGDGVVKLQSGDWALRGSSENVLKDSRFMKSFDINLTGTLYIEQVIDKLNRPIIEAKGKVVYEVEGIKPSIFKAAPAFVLKGVIDVIQDGVMDYTETQFASRFLKAFRLYVAQQAQQAVN